MYRNPYLPDPFNARACDPASGSRPAPMKKQMQKPILEEPKINERKPDYKEAPILEHASPPKMDTETCEKNCCGKPIEKASCSPSCNDNQFPVILLLLCLYGCI
ncbi:hypothetical protein CLNEO_01160 [Anaerotignum neopropionicum]|uniref:Uncharacterized protein n=1 Tax=Anaerotignum neopropionicum TaxID=36847 RepID=A0A136WI15_9FIRM|nr:hypothetical protein [Anaerotignum neopropionicum]KXL54020.1 hypothetical protein CLNEO_01160 [Anaerotignum neopropionicum]